MSLERNLRLASETVRYVANRMTIGASNRIESYYSGMLAPLLCVTAIRSVRYGSEGSIEHQIMAAAGKAEATGCGNCGEQAAIAYKHLVKRLLASPVDYMHRTTADHAFVVIGRVERSDPADPQTWGPDAAVCDPWDKASYAARSMNEKMFRGTSEKLLGFSVLKPDVVLRSTW